MDYKNELHSDDDFDYSNSGYNDNGSPNYPSHRQAHNGNPNGLSKAELRKTNKPIMEKRRRARINRCLNELKTLILEAMKKDPARHTKLEKADILEMTVKHLQSVQRQQLNMAIQSDPSVIHKFKTGFIECAEEVNRYVSQLEGIDATTRQRLNNHLNNCATSLEQIGAMTNFNNGYRHGQQLTNALATSGNGNSGASLLSTSLSTNIPTFPPALTQDLNNNNNNHNSRLGSTGGGAIQMNGVQLIPSRLPSGELALIVPNPQAANAAANLLNNNASNNSFSTWPSTAAAPTAAPTTMPLMDHAATTLPMINNFASQLQRMSAFSKPPAAPLLPTLLSVPTMKPKLSIIPTTHMPTKPKFHTTTAAAFHQTLPQNSTTATSPPLSPISSVSSLSGGVCDDSSSAMHISADLTSNRGTTPTHESTTATNLVLSQQQHSFSGAFNTPPLSTESSLCLSSASTSGTSSLSLSKHLQQQQVSSTSGGSSESLHASRRKRSLEASEYAYSSDGSFDEPASKKFAASTASVVVSDLEDDAALIAAEHTMNSGDCKKQLMQDERDCMWRPW